ncbi:MAG TPA: hypothetical protein VFF68_02120 [Anaerolineaceae bacterium]|nr:hypothetical protein [Anaerolineaceae bacterium]
MDRLAAAVQPLSVLVVTNLFGAAAALLQMLWVRNKDEASFARAALVLLVSLDVFAFLSGFSIGGWVALATVPIGVVLGLLARQYRAQIAAATAVNLLMFLATGLHWQAAAVLYRGAPLALMALGGLGWRGPGQIPGGRADTGSHLPPAWRFRRW